MCGGGLGWGEGLGAIVPPDDDLEAMIECGEYRFDVMIGR